MPDNPGVSEQAWPAPVVLAEPQPGDFCCIPVSGSLGLGIEVGSWLAARLEGGGSRGLKSYDHAEVYVGQADAHGPHGYTYSAYPDNGTRSKTGRRALPCPPAQLPGAIWSSGILPLTGEERAGIVSWCMDHPCVPYSWPDYGAIALHALGLNADWLREYIQSTASMVCSYYTDASYNHGGGVHLFTDGRWEGFVTPYDLADLLLAKARLRGAA
jgi:hypothetical protein